MPWSNDMYTYIAKKTLVTLVLSLSISSYALSYELSEVHDGDLQLALEGVIQKHGIVGASMAVYADGKLLTAAAGLASRFTGYPVEKDTLMHIGSITKVFTATLIMQLVDEGLVELSSPAIDYFDKSREYPKHFEAITVKSLINHTSGINGEMFPEGSHDEEIMANAVDRILEQPLLFIPGEHASYSNGGAVIAAHLIQSVLGISWYEAIKNKIFEPAGMDHSAVLPEDAIAYKTSIGHLRDPKTRAVYVSPGSFTRLSYAPAGSTAMMTASDLVKFARIHLNEGVAPNGTRILSEKSVGAMRRKTSRYRGFGANGSWGLGWELSDGGLVRHGGGGSGVGSLLITHPERDFAAAVLTNTEGGFEAITEILNPYMVLLAPSDLILPTAPRPVADSLDADRYVGVYEDALIRFDVRVLDGRLTCSIKVKTKIYDNSSTQPTPHMALERVGRDVFNLTLEAGMASMPSGGSMVLTFLNPLEGGAMGHIATRNRLYKRNGNGVPAGAQ